MQASEKQTKCTILFINQLFHPHKPNFTAFTPSLQIKKMFCKKSVFFPGILSPSKPGCKTPRNFAFPLNFSVL